MYLLAAEGAIDIFIDNPVKLSGVCLSVKHHSNKKL